MKVSGLNEAAEDRRLEQAADWFAALQDSESSELPPAQLRGWDQWIADPANRAAFDRIARLWQESSALVRPALPTQAELEADEDIVSVKPQWGHHFSSRASLGLAAAAVLALGAVLIFVLRGHGSTAAEQLMVQETAAGEHRELKLSDGTLITLGARSALSVQYTSNRRTIVLDRGEALFDVARNPSRPFVVFAGKGTITALGTAFNVLRDAERVVVTVAEGAVEVASKAAPTPARLAPGDEVSYNAQGERTVVKQTDPQLATAWRQGHLRYRQEPLQYVVDDVNRYSQRQVILDPQLGEFEFTGTVFRDDIDEWIAGLERIFPIEVVPVDAQHVLLRSHTPPP